MPVVTRLFYIRKISEHVQKQNEQAEAQQNIKSGVQTFGPAVTPKNQSVFNVPKK
jgi:hypothetical protein